MSKLENKYICIAKIGKLIGVKGNKFRCFLFIDNLKDLNCIPYFYVYRNKEFQKIPKICFENNLNKSLCYFTNSDFMDYTLSNLVNKKIYILRSTLSDTENNEFYIVDLIDCKAMLNNEIFGYINNVNNYGSCNLFYIKSIKGNYFYIPFLNRYIDKIDIKNKIIKFVNLEGFLEV